MNYYNDNDKHACAWLRELISEGLIPKGKVDERSIADVQPDDLRDFTQCHFFAGIGGWAHALRLAGWSESLPVWTGSCPCQPFSCAGKAKAQQDERHLWPHFFRLIRECRPDFVFGEQVEGAIGHGWLDGIQRDLEGEAYAIGHCVLGAHSVGAPHIRQRLYWMAHSECAGLPSEQTERESRQAETSHAATRGESCGVAESPGAEQRKSDAPKPAGKGAAGGGCTPSCPTCGKSCHMRDRGEFEWWCTLCDRAWHIGKLSCYELPASHCGGRMEHATLSTASRFRPQREHLSGATTFWSDAIWHQCRDGKARRIPRFESGVLGLASRIPEGMDLGWLDSSFPLCEKIKGRVGLLKGYGNSIVPEVAAQFILAAKEVIQ